MKTNHFDVLIVGAGISGISAAYHLQDKCLGKTYAILERRAAIGGTWDIFRYPGIRSDSDMFTLGYNFKPWTDTQIIADGPKIRDYVRETARENGIDRHIRFGHKVIKASWSSETALWTVEAKVGSYEAGVEPKVTDAIEIYTCNFLMMCSGYYNYDKGYVPEFKGLAKYKGKFVLPQFWPKDLDYAGKKVVVIGSGATAVTVVPAMTDKAAHVTMVQRSPTYVLTVPQRDLLSRALRRVLPEMFVYRIGRTRNIALTAGMFKLSRSRPKAVRRLLLAQVRAQVGKSFDMRHFTPSYNPWDQRLCAVPNGDMFRALKMGKASVVTDHVDCFTEQGIKLKSGKELVADMVVCATGLELQLFGGTEFVVDGEPYQTAQALNYKGMMFSDLPNLSNTMGYTNASWTLKADLIAEYVCRLLGHMDKTGTKICVPRVNDASVKRTPFLDMTSGYLQRAVDRLPQQGDKVPWKLFQNYALDMNMIRRGRIDDGAMQFSRPRVSEGSKCAPATS
ncbi:MAG: FAD-containing monooxygenase EthA [Moraxellaceae bacterium]|jgi:cation diffusion facilitator CzcD-associated flavoprotein CzcO|nr:FAD-containing monooxygenase EthA [Moraxellaceae bacterium]MDF3029796.1 FAD-containing monooxygenase EthA [Moraxellaceae bacterium]